MYVSRQHQKVNLRSLKRTQWLIFVKLCMWVVGGTSTTHVVCSHRMCIFNTSFAYLFWLTNNEKSNIQSSVWATLMKLGMWVVMGTNTTHVVCRHRMRIFNTSFAYLFWLANNKKVKYSEFCMSYIDETWYVGSDGHKYYPCGCRHQMHIFTTALAYLFWLANNKKVKYSEFCMGCIDKTCYVGSDGYKYYPCGLPSPNAYI